MSTAQSGCGISTKGYQVTGLVLRGVISGDELKVPFLLSCRGLLDTRRDAATPFTVSAHSHVAQYADRFPDFDETAHTMVLLGRDCGGAMVAQLLNNNEPYLYDTPLGLALVGSVCADIKSNIAKSTKYCSTLCTQVHQVLSDKVSSIDNKVNNEYVDPCFHTLSSSVEPRLTSPVFVQYDAQTLGRRSSTGDVFSTHADESCVNQGLFSFTNTQDPALHDIFSTLPDDELPGLSRNDRDFLDILNDGVTILKDGSIQLPLPFRKDNIILPDNRNAVYGRTLSTLAQLSKHSERVQQSLDAMQHNINQCYVEQVKNDAPTPAAGSVWYIPVFPVVHNKKLKVRLVFDASAQYLGVSINDHLYKGPELTNRLRGVLLRFREKPVAIQADIQDMFLRFKVPESQRDFLRFYWYKNNDVNQPLVPYRATMHIFGLSSSPVVANFGLKYCPLQATS